MILYKLPSRAIVPTIAILVGLTSYAAADIVDTSPHPPSSDHFAISNGKRSELLALKGTETKFLKPRSRRNIRGVWKTKIHDRKLQAPPQLLDIIVGNIAKSGAINQLLLNNGNGTFSESDLPGGALSTKSIATADVNNDGFDDIIFGNQFSVNQLLLNNGNNTFTASDLPGGGVSTGSSIATADVNNDEFDDIIVAKFNQANQLLINNGNNTFTVSDLPGGALSTSSVATADVNNDGNVDIIFGNSGVQFNQLLLNNGNGTFTESDLPGPGGALSTTSIAVIRKAPAPAPASTSEYTLYLYMYMMVYIL